MSKTKGDIFSIWEYLLFHFRDCYGKSHGVRSKKTAPVPRLTAVLFACAPIAIRAFASLCAGIKFVRLGWWPIILFLTPWNVPENGNKNLRNYKIRDIRLLQSVEESSQHSGADCMSPSVLSEALSSLVPLCAHPKRERVWNRMSGWSTRTRNQVDITKKWHLLTKIPLT